ncbi:carboxyltransferase domain-containing protein, partial [Gammaproteobacteria bacterium]|nr:carboxyltransferase domain-containing protein [Gammaproteobacteria bacterium]
YEIFAIGFAPNFAFLGKISNAIRVPRLKTPRISVPAGSVGIADSQTGVYPINSPGGWNLVGKTPLDLSISNNEISSYLRVGGKVRFKPISRDEFISQGGLL